MDAVAFTRVAVIPAVALAGWVLLAWPVWRAWRRTGRLPVTRLSRAGPAQGVLGAGLLATTTGLVIWCLLYAWLGPDRLGVWAWPSVTIWIGWCLLAVGFVLITIAQRTMGDSWRMGVERPEPEADAEDHVRLITHGVFARVRNPIYSGMMVLAGGLFVLSPSIVTLAGLLLAVVLLTGQARLEERLLARRVGPPYVDYAARTGRFIPGVGRRASSDEGRHRSRKDDDHA